MLISDPAARSTRSVEKHAALMRFLSAEIWTTAEIIGELWGISSRQGVHKTLMQYEAEGDIRRHTLPVAGSSNVTLWGITNHGAAMAVEGDSEAAYIEQFKSMRYFDPSRLSLSRVPHHLDLQRTRLAMERAGWTGWTRGEALGFKRELRPDAVVTRPDGVRLAIEVERTIKTRKRYGVVIAGHLANIQQGSWQGVWYLCPDRVARTLPRLFASIDVVRHAGRTVPFDDSLRRYFRIHDMAECLRGLNHGD